MGKKHDRGKAKADFCAIPGTPCKCSGANNYRTVCKPGWSTHTFERVVNRKPKKIVVKIGYEAHHILCVSSVSTKIVSNKNIEPVVLGTTWCINRKTNMIALPLWGHSVKWYCKITKTEQAVKARAPAPPFHGLPQHDWDHNCTNGYTDEVTEDMKKVADQVKSAKKKHEIDKANLAGKMNARSRHWRSQLKTRGSREGGTHKCWSKGKNATDTKWCQPFSMANNRFVESKSFPVRDFDESTAKWMERIAKAIKLT